MKKGKMYIIFYKKEKTKIDKKRKMMKNTQKTTKIVKKSHLLAKIVLIWTVFLLILCLGGCAKTDPVDSVIDHHHDHITDVLDYAKNNIEQNKDVVFLENELKGCDLALIDVKQVYYGQISTCRAETRYWKLATGSMFLVVVGLIIAIIKRWFR